VKREDKFKLSLDVLLNKNEKGLAHRIIDGQAVVINLKRNTFNILNTVATRIWELVDGWTTLGQIMEKIYQEFNVDWSTLNRDCLVFLRELLEKDLLIASFPAEGISNHARLIETEEGLFDSLREKAIVKQIPLIVHFDLTYRCNLDCVHCYIVSENRSVLTVDEIKNILEQLAEAGTLYLTLSGGEVLTRKDFFEIAQHARKLHFALRILTNGTLVDEVMAEKIVSLNPEMVAISIYSTKPEVHDKITRMSGSFQKSISAAEMLKDRDTRLKISTVIMKENKDDYRAIYELSRQMGAAFQADYRITPKTDGNKAPLAVHIDEEYLPVLLADPIFTEKSESEPQEVYLGMFNTIPCGAGHMSCYITPYGDVYPCVQLPINCGNLKEAEFTEIWKNSSKLSEFRSITISNLTSCSQCEFFKYCRICVGLNYVEEGSMFIPSKRACQEARIMKELGRERR
jgi:radical SAM protein with 4Fe4S-binding SPASM domain